MKRLVATAAIFLGIGLLCAARPGDSVDDLMRRLADPKRAVADKAAKALQQRGQEAVPALVKTLAENGPVNERAMAVLGRIGAPAVPELSKALASKSIDVRRLAATALKFIGPDAKDAVPALTDAVKAGKDKPGGPDRLQMIDALGAIGPAAKDAVPLLTAALKERDEHNAVPLHAAVALGQIGPTAKGAVPALMEALQTREGKTGALRIHVMEALGRMGPAASAAVPDLLRNVKSNRGAGRMLALELLAQIGVDDKAKLAGLDELMADPDFSVRLNTAKLIGRADPDNKTVVTVLVEALEGKEAYRRKLAAEILETVHPRDAAVREALTAAANDRDPAVRQAAARALKTFKKTP